MEIKKSQWVGLENTFQLTMPLMKVDKARRIVSGFATLDNADTQDDVVLPEASRAAFTRFRGNIREMHQPIAAGRMVNFREETFFDDKTQKMYSGIWVDVYVSKGAEPTWEKVLDGTLTGFSIAGPLHESESEFRKVGDHEKRVRIVKNYDLTELSLVDVPANTLASIVSIQKSAGGDTIIKGLITTQNSENVFYCLEDEIAKTTSEDSLTCTMCKKSMKNIGWFEYDNEGEVAEKVAGVVSQFKKIATEKQEVPAETEGGVNVAEKTVTEEVNEPGVEVVEEAPVVEEADATEVEAPAADVEEVPADEPDVAKMFSDLKDSLIKSITESTETTTSKVEEISKSFETKVEELTKSHSTLETQISELKTQFEAINNRVDSVESDTAVKKSGDLGGSTEPLEKVASKGLWGGTFLGTSDL